MSKRVFFINITFFLAIAISVFSIKRFMDSSTGERDLNNANSPDSYMVDASYLRTNDNGQRDVIVFSPKVTHYKDQDTSHFQNPKIQIYKNGEEWHITSRNAKGIQGANTLYLYDNVKVKQLPSKKNGSTLLSTNTLTIFPKQNIVSTKDYVTIEQPGLKISAIGLRGDLNTGDIQLLSKTRGQYDPKQSH
ncbi:MAG: LPS export ABC transporter periplasmic protein LptC [Gammaproteobacteria bacterium]|nr:LPS export ABC transporter periplasmic protein LptC [Gammaproteobacteria bacterium]